ERARPAGRRPDLRGRHPPRALGQGGAEPRGGADLRGRRDEHDADPGGEAVRQAQGAVDRTADRGCAPGRVRGEQRLRDLPRREPVGHLPSELSPTSSALLIRRGILRAVTEVPAAVLVDVHGDAVRLTEIRRNGYQAYVPSH